MRHLRPAFSKTRRQARAKFDPHPGNSGDHWSGDIFVAFSTANRLPGSNMTWQAPPTTQVQVLSNNFMDPLYDAVVEATQEAILNAQLAAQTMVGRDGVTAHALDPERLVSVLRKYERLRFEVNT